MATSMENATYDLNAQTDFLSKISKHFNVEIVTKRQINEFVKLHNLPYPKFIFSKKFEAGFGKYRVATSHPSADQEVSVQDNVVPIVKQERVHATRLAANITDILIPNKDKTYVPFGFYNKLKKIIDSKIFYPVYITGLSGNGKTLMVEQICANTDREMVRVNITKDTDETDLIGSYELIDGNTVRREGPVVTAMRKGAILLLDETDYGTERLLCLQPILEGKPYLDKKTGEIITPTDGFNIIATANTKGKGSDDGRFIGANTLNEAFLERFAITVEQEYPSPDVEKQIILRNFTSLKINDNKFADMLTTWADIVRKTYADGGVDEIISTRRLVHIAKAYSIFNNRMEAIELCLNRFEGETKRAFLDMYTKVDDDASAPIPIASSDMFDDNNIKNAMGGAPVVNTPPPVATGAGGAVQGFKAAPVTGSNGNTHVSTPVHTVTVPVGNLTDSITVSADKLPAFASVKNLFSASQKFNEKVKIGYDAKTLDWIVESHGFQTRVSQTALAKIKETKEGEFLDLLVAANQNKKTSKIPAEYRPIQ
jgi:hypothetical protein